MLYVASRQISHIGDRFSPARLQHALRSKPGPVEQKRSSEDRKVTWTQALGVFVSNSVLDFSFRVPTTTFLKSIR